MMPLALMMSALPDVFGQTSHHYDTKWRNIIVRSTTSHRRKAMHHLNFLRDVAL